MKNKFFAAPLFAILAIIAISGCDCAAHSSVKEIEYRQRKVFFHKMNGEYIILVDIPNQKGDQVGHVYLPTSTVIQDLQPDEEPYTTVHCCGGDRCNGFNKYNSCFHHVHCQAEIHVHSIDDIKHQGQ